MSSMCLGGTINLPVDSVRFHRGRQYYHTYRYVDFQRSQIPHEFLYQAFGLSGPVCGILRGVDRYHLEDYHFLGGWLVGMQDYIVFEMCHHVLLHIPSRGLEFR